MIISCDQTIINPWSADFFLFFEFLFFLSTFKDGGGGDKSLDMDLIKNRRPHIFFSTPTPQRIFHGTYKFILIA